MALSLLLPLRLFGTAQEADRIVYQGDTLELFALPLESYLNRGFITRENLFQAPGCLRTSCWRGYVATWEFVGTELYLVEISNSCDRTELYAEGFGKDSASLEFADLKTLFPDRYKNGKVKADWVSGNLISPQGALLYPIHDGFQSIYEKELEFTIESGILTGIKWLDNSKTKVSKYLENKELLTEYIQNNINPEALPASDTLKRRVLVRVFSADDNGKIDSVEIVSGVNEWYDREAIRVVKSIPDWEVLYYNGKRLKRVWTVPVYFDRTEKNEQVDP